MKTTAKELRLLLSQETTEEPFMDLYETGDDLVCEVDLPGINPETILIKVFEDTLIIEGVKSESHNKMRDQRYLCLERYLDSFRRIVKIPVSVHLKDGRAYYRDGVVRIIFPKIKEKVFKIKIEKEDK